MKETDVVLDKEVTAIDSSYFETKEMTEEVVSQEKAIRDRLPDIQRGSTLNEKKNELLEGQINALASLYRHHQCWPQYVVLYQNHIGSMAIREEYNRAIITIERIQDTLKNTLPPTEFSYLIIKYVYAVSLYELGIRSRSAQAFDDYFEAINLLETSGQVLPFPLVGISYLGAANLAALENNYKRADSLLTILEYKIDRPPYNKSSQEKDLVNTRASILDVRALISKQHQEWTEALKTYEKVAHVLTSPALSGDTASISDKGRVWYNIGEIHERQGRITEALTAYNRSLEEISSVPPSSFQLALLHSAIARATVKTGNLEQVDQSLAASFQYLKSTPEPVTYLQPPKLEELYIGIETYAIVFSTTRSLKLILSKGKLASHSRDSLKALQGYCLLAVDIIDSLRRQTHTKLEDSPLLADSSMQMYELAIDVTLALGEKEGIHRLHTRADDSGATDESPASAAFALADQSRGNWLISGVSNNLLKEYDLLDSTIVDEINQLEYSARRYSEQLLFMNFSSTDEEKKEKLRLQLSECRNKLTSAIQSLSVNAADYYALKYSPPQATVQQVQNELLTEQEAWIEYFVGENTITCFLIIQDDLQLFRTEKPSELENWIKTVKLKQTYSSVPTESANIPYEIAAYQLYETLFAEPLNLLNETGDKWYVTVVPHESLINLNFGVLLTAPITPDIEQSYHQWPYLERNSNLILSYEISATLGLTQFAFSEKKGTGSVWFGTDDKDMSEIDRTTNALASRYGGDYFQADESFFKQAAGEYDLIHIGGHGAGNEQAAAEPQVFLSNRPSDTEDNRLTLSELYQLNLHASLAVILSCESALGEGHETEGSLSIARGFRYAGVPTTVVSQGKIPVENSADIAAAMYQNLEKGMRVDEALHLAKIAYLESHENDLAAPDLWSGLVVQGKSSAILPLESVLPWWIWLGLSALIVLLSIGWIIRRTRLSSRS